MPFLSVIAPGDAADETAEMYAGAERAYGYLPNMVALFGHRPEVMTGWTALLSAVRGNMDPRRYELVTLAAARALGSSYCLLAHGSVLLTLGLTGDQVAAIAAGAADAPLSAQERAIMDYAAHVARDAASVTAAEVAALRATGLAEAEIFDIAAAAAMRCFFSKLLDGLGAEPDRAYAALPAPMRQALAIGRPIEG